MWKIIENKELDLLKNSFDWTKDMEKTPQDSIYHAEGNVWIHTRMVLEALVKLPEYQKLNTQEQEILWAAALMHDIEKRSTTVEEENGRISSAGHAKKGALTTRRILYQDISTPFHIRENIVGLVRHHGFPLWVFDKQNPQKSLLQVSFETNTAWIYLLSKADILGRICEDKEKLLYKIDLFKEFCIENDCWGNPKHFSSNLAKFSYFQKENQSPDYEPYNNEPKEAILLSGIAGSGNTKNT